MSRPFARTRLARLPVLSLVVVLAVLAVLAFAASGCGCGKEDSGGTESPETPSTNALPKLELTDDTGKLLLTWVDDKGDFHVVQKIADVPEAARERVRVVVTDSVEGTGRLVYVADLRSKDAAGKYAVQAISRASWEAIGADRRKSRLEALAPSVTPPIAPSAVPPVEVAGKVDAVVYGADWCKPCHDAERYLKQKGVHVTMKNIEKSDIARKEMQKKLAKAGRSGASIPVIDVAGQIIVGYSAPALDRAITVARGAQAL